MSWLAVIILSYLFFALFAFGDKLMLSGRGSLRPATYTFYIGLLNVFVIFLIPFAHFSTPSLSTLVFIVLNGIVFNLGLYTMFLALEKFEVSRVMPAIGALQPAFILLATAVIFGIQPLALKDFIVFVILIAGTFIIAKGKNGFSVSWQYILLAALSSLFFSLDYVFAKAVFLNLPFLEGLILTRLAMFFFGSLFIFSRQARNQIFLKKEVFNKRTLLLSLATQGSGAIATFFQSFAIWLAPVSYLAIMNALRGVQYVFLFAMTLIFSLFFPKILKEEISIETIFHKAVSIILIITGLVILVL